MKEDRLYAIYTVYSTVIVNNKAMISGDGLSSTNSAEEASSTPYHPSLLLANTDPKQLSNIHQDVIDAINAETSASTSSIAAAYSKWNHITRNDRRGSQNQSNYSRDIHITIPRIIQRCQEELRDTRKAMRTLAQHQVTTGGRALHILDNSTERVEQLRDNFQAMGEFITSAQTAESYTYLRKLHFLNQNISSVIQWTETLKAVHRTPFGQMLENLEITEVHQHVRQMAEIRRTVARSATGPQHRAHRAFEPYFQKQVVIDMLLFAKVRELFASCVTLGIQDGLREARDPEDKEFTAFKACVRACEVERADPVIRETNIATRCDNEEGDLADFGYNYNSEEGEEYSSSGESNKDNDLKGDNLSQNVKRRYKVISPIAKLTQEKRKRRYFFEKKSPFGTASVAKAMAVSINKYWSDEILGETHNITQNVNLIEGVKPVFVTLEWVFQPLSTQFPLFEIFVRTFHEKIIGVFTQFTAPGANVEAHILIQGMSVLSWYRNMLEECNFTQYIKKPAKEIQRLSANMLANAVGGMAEHMANRAKGCAIQICKSSFEDPESTGSVYMEKHPNGELLTSGPLDLFVILQQSLVSSVTSCVDRSVLIELGNACVGAIDTYLSHCRDVSSYEEWEDANDERPEPLPVTEWAPMRLKQLCAFGNDLISIEENLETVEAKFIGVWKVSETKIDEYCSVGNSCDVGRGDGKRKTRSGESPFLELTERISYQFQNYYIAEILKHFEVVTTPTGWNKLFLLNPPITSGERKEDEIAKGQSSTTGDSALHLGNWYDASLNPLTVILETYTDFITQDMIFVLNKKMVSLLVKEAVRQVCIIYIDSLLRYCKGGYKHDQDSSGRKFNSAQFSLCLDRDIYAISECWTNIYNNVKHLGITGNKHQYVRHIEKCTKAIRVLYDFFTADSPEHFETYVEHKILEDYGDCPTIIPNIIFNIRPELHRKERESFINCWKKCIAGQERNEQDMPTKGHWAGSKTILADVDRIIDIKEKKGLFGRSSKTDNEKSKEVKARVKRRQEREAKKRAAAERAVSLANRMHTAEQEIGDLATVLGELE